jgi:1,4-alpha-glucan branching enzyme
VVHGKGSLYGKIPGDKWQKLATLRAYFAFMWTHPGKKLLFMGGEIGQACEWSHDGEIHWQLLSDPAHAGLQRALGDLNRLYVSERALHAGDDDPSAFCWTVGDDRENSVYAYERHAAGASPILVVVNMTPVPRSTYRVGVSRPGRWRELLNTDAAIYGGSNVGNGGSTRSQPLAAHGHEHSLELILPPLSTLILKPED